MSRYRMRAAARVTGAFLLLLLPLAACDGGDDDANKPSAMATADTSHPTYTPSPSPHGEETVTLRRTHQGYVTGLKIGVIATSDGEATISINKGPGIDKDNPQKVAGEAGDTLTLDNGYTITIDQVENSDPDSSKKDKVDGTGSVTLTVQPPDK